MDQLTSPAMSTGAIAPVDIAALSQQISALSAQVAYLTEQAQLAERARQERAELLRDLMPIANDAFRLSVEQLEEVQEYVDLSDLLRLLKRLLRNGRNFEAMLDQLESVLDLVATVGPLSDDAFAKMVDLLQAMEHKGYFAFARGGLQIADNVVTSFSEDDVRALSDNIVLILNVVKSVTQPEMMRFVQNTVAAVDRQKDVPVNTSLPALLRDLRDPNVRRGLALTLRVLRTVGQQTNGR